MALLAQPSQIHQSTSATMGMGNKPRWSLHGHDEEVLALATRGGVFASSSADGVSLLWRFNQSGSIENVCKVSSHGPAVLDTTFLSANSLACAQGDGCVKVWNVERGVELDCISRGTVRGRNPWPVVNTVAASPTEEKFFFGGDDGYLAQCDIRQDAAKVTWINMKVPITSSCCTADSLFVGDVCGQSHWLDLRMLGAAVDSLPCGKGAVTSLCPDAQAERLAALSLDGTLRVLDIQPFASSRDERLLAAVPVFEGTDCCQLLRADWNWKDDLIAIPVSNGNVHCVSGSSSSGEIVRRVEASDNSSGSSTNAVAFMGRHHMVIGGTTSLMVQEM